MGPWRRRGRGALRAGLLGVPLLTLVGGATSCSRGPAADPPPLLVLAASDLQVAFEEILERFEAYSGHRVHLVLGSTGNLATQIRNGAPADLFFAANERFLDDLIAAGRIQPDSRRSYARGRLVLIVPPGAHPPTDLAALLRPEFGIVAIANPDHAPYGMAAKDALDASGLWEALAPRIVLGENIAQAHQLVRTGNADAGIVALGLVSGAGVSTTPYNVVPAELHPPLRQAAGIVTGTRRPDAARALLDFVGSPEGQEILARHGFEPPDDAEPKP